MKPSKRLNSEDHHHPHRQFEQQIREQSTRKLKARQEGDRSIWMGLGMFGMIGWSIIVPTLLGIALGLWIDRRFPSPYSWTLMLLFLGLVLGCFNAWHWIEKEQDAGE